MDADTLDNETNNIKDEKMIGFKGQHGMKLRISPIPVGMDLSVWSSS